MDFAARQVPQKEGVDRAEQELARLRAAAREGHVVEDPADLGGGKIGVRVQTGARVDPLAVLFFDLFTIGGGAAALPDDRVVDGLAREAVPYERRLALVGDADGGDLRGRDIPARSAARKDSSCEVSRSRGSCSTQPGRG